MRFKSRKRSSCVCFGFQASFCLTWPDGYHVPCLSICQASHLLTVVLVWERQSLSNSVLSAFLKVFLPRLCPGTGSEGNSVQWELNMREFSLMAQFHCRLYLLSASVSLRRRATDAEQKTARDKMMWKISEVTERVVLFQHLLCCLTRRHFKGHFRPFCKYTFFCRILMRHCMFPPLECSPRMHCKN